MERGTGQSEPPKCNRSGYAQQKNSQTPQDSTKHVTERSFVDVWNSSQNANAPMRMLAKQTWLSGDVRAHAQNVEPSASKHAPPMPMQMFIRTCLLYGWCSCRTKMKRPGWNSMQPHGSQLDPCVACGPPLQLPRSSPIRNKRRHFEWTRHLTRHKICVIRVFQAMLYLFESVDATSTRRQRNEELIRQCLL